MNVTLLQTIKRRILRDPQKFRMDEWSCGTAHCIAGWACVLMKDPPKFNAEWEDFGNTKSGHSVEMVAICALNLPNARMFFTSDWPERLYSRYVKARTRKARAQVAAAAIDDYIARNGNWEEW